MNEFVGMVMTTVLPSGKRVTLIQLPRTLDDELDLRVSVGKEEIGEYRSRIKARAAFHQAVRNHGGTRSSTLLGSFSKEA